jgi:O-antigen/teichoic acid export membrane protein
VTSPGRESSIARAAAALDHGPGAVARGFLALGLGEAASRLIGFAATVFAARTLGAELFGAIAFAAAVVLYANRVVDGGFELGLGVREIAADPAFLPAAAPTVLTVRTLLALALAGGVSLGGLLLLPEPDGAVLALQSLTLFAVGMGTRWIHLGFRRTALAAAATTAGQLLMAAVVFALVRGPGDVAAVPAAQALGDLAAAALLLLALRRIAGPLRVAIDWSVVRRLLGRAWHLVASALLGIAIFTAGILLLRAFSGAAAAGYYAASYTLVTFLLNVGAMYNLSLLPSLTSLAADPARQHALYQAAVAHVFAASLPVAVGGSMLAGPIVTTVFGSGYAPAALPLALLVWSLPLNLARDVPLMALMSAGRERLVLRVTLFSAVLSAALGLALVPRFGLAGAAWSTLAAESARVGLAVGYARSAGFPGFELKRLARPLAAGLVMAAGLLGFGRSSLWADVPLGVLLYATGLLVSGGIKLGPGGRPRFVL